MGEQCLPYIAPQDEVSVFQLFFGGSRGFGWDLFKQKWLVATWRPQKFQGELQPSPICSSWKNLW